MAVPPEAIKLHDVDETRELLPFDLLYTIKTKVCQSLLAFSIIKTFLMFDFCIKNWKRRSLTPTATERCF
ncbi:MAG: hypothetical protein RR338_01850 [Clostridia bacterium]